MCTHVAAPILPLRPSAKGVGRTSARWLAARLCREPRRGRAGRPSGRPCALRSSARSAAAEARGRSVALAADGSIHVFLHSACQARRVSHAHACPCASAVGSGIFAHREGPHVCRARARVMERTVYNFVMSVEEPMGAQLRRHIEAFDLGTARVMSAFLGLRPVSSVGRLLGISANDIDLAGRQEIEDFAGDV